MDLVAAPAVSGMEIHLEFTENSKGRKERDEQ
jgi:hypothetical protein